MARAFAREILSARGGSAFGGKAIVIGLAGELGAGKTVFAKGFARGLGIREEMKSPTFILMRVFRIPASAKASAGKHFFHFDAYRIADPKEFLALGFRKLLKNPFNVLLVEWSDKIKKILPKKYFKFSFKVRGKTFREISLSI